MNGKPNPSLQKKTAARMAAVQCLYTLSITGETRTPQQLVAALKKQLANNAEEQKLVVGQAVEPNYAFVETLLQDIDTWRPDIDQRLDGVLKANWKRERMSPLLVAILQCAIAEMIFGKGVKATIVIDEYTRLTRRFFADAEADFVHGALHALAQQHG